MKAQATREIERNIVENERLKGEISRSNITTSDLSFPAWAQPSTKMVRAPIHSVKRSWRPLRSKTISYPMKWPRDSYFKPECLEKGSSANVLSKAYHHRRKKKVFFFWGSDVLHRYISVTWVDNKLPCFISQSMRTRTVKAERLRCGETGFIFDTSKYCR